LLRAAAFVFLRRDAQGRLAGFEGGQLEEEWEIRQVNALIAALASQALDAPLAGQKKAKVAAALAAASTGDFGLSLADLHRLGERLAPRQSLMVILMENLWERTLGEIVARHDGQLAGQRLIPAASLARLGEQLAGAQPR
jgi:hypothetical protein